MADPAQTRRSKLKKAVKPPRNPYSEIAPIY